MFVAFILAVSPKWSSADLQARFSQCTDVGEKLRWQAVMLKKEGRSAREIASICGRNEDWVRRTVSTVARNRVISVHSARCRHRPR